MGSGVGAVLCCCQCCCGDVADTCKQILGPQKLTKISYFLLEIGFLFPVILVLILFNLLQEWVSLSPTQIITRLCCSLLVLFLSMLLTVVCHNSCARRVNEGCFGAKYIMIALLFIGSMFLTNQVFIVIFEIAKYLSILYLLIQSIILIDLSYIAGRKLVQQYDDGQSTCGGVLIGGSAVVFSLALLLNIISYVSFSEDKCGSTLWVSVITTVLIVMMVLIQLLNLNPQNSLLTTALVSLLVSYYAYSAQVSFKTGCKHRLTMGTFAIDVAVSVILFVISTYGSIEGGLSGQEEYEAILQAEKDLQLADEKTYSDTNIWVKWHFFMSLATLYLCMILSNWESNRDIAKTPLGNDFAFWVKTITSFVTSLIYMWTMVAPSVLTNRDFEFE